MHFQSISYLMMTLKYCFSRLFPKRKIGYNLPQKREKNLNLRHYINQRLLNKDRKFSQNQEYIFAFQYATEIKQLKGDMYNALKQTTTNGRKINARDVRNFEKFNGVGVQRYCNTNS